MKTSTTGINLIKSFEGCRLTAYKDSVNIWTIGYGHTSGVYSGQKITQQQADTFLTQDITKAEAQVNKYQAKYNFNQNEFDALVSFAFNIGSITQLTSNGTRTKAQIASHMRAYNKAGGKVLTGLTKRRQAEYDLYIKPISTPKKEDDDVKIENLTVLVNGKKVVVNAVNIDGNNFIKLRDIEKLANIVVDYDGKNPTVKDK